MEQPRSGSGRRPNLQQKAQNRSLQRGIEILRAFRPGTDLLGNGELADRTGLSKATVSRLTQTLVSCGMLDYAPRDRAYRLATPVLSIAHAMLLGSPILRHAAPLMRAVAERKRINVGLAVADREEMVYLSSTRFNRKASLRTVVAGQRVPMVLTSLGRAHLAAVPTLQRQRLFAQFKARNARQWRQVESEIACAIDSVQSVGYCAASWQPGVVALATPLCVAEYPIYALNVSVSTQKSLSVVSGELGAVLMRLAGNISDAVQDIHRDADTGNES